MNNKCTIENCPNDAFCRGWCKTHYYKWNIHGDPLFSFGKCAVCGKPEHGKGLCRSCIMKKRWRNKKQTICKVADCSRKHYGKGYCKHHYERMKYMGSLEPRIIINLPNEEWREVIRLDCTGLMISNMGRVKSCRKYDEMLLLSKMTKVNPREKQLTRVAANGLGGNILVHMEVLRAFHPNYEEDYRAIFIDSDRSNCKSNNLRWYGKRYLIGEALKMAEKSDHPLANKFKLFWLGDHNALNDWFDEQTSWIGPYIHSRLNMFNVPFYVDVSNCVQEVVLRIFLSLERGMLRELNQKSLRTWIKRIARIVLAIAIKKLLPAYSNDREDSEGNSYSITDLIGWCHPSAELQVIYKQEQKLL